MGIWQSAPPPNYSNGTASGTITCSNGYKVTASNGDFSCYKNDVLQYTISKVSLKADGHYYHTDSVAAVAFIRMCTGM
jgi:hypothetical protein